MAINLCDAISAKQNKTHKQQQEKGRTERGKQTEAVKRKEGKPEETGEMPLHQMQKENWHERIAERGRHRKTEREYPLKPALHSVSNANQGKWTASLVTPKSDSSANGIHGSSKNESQEFA